MMSRRKSTFYNTIYSEPGWLLKSGTFIITVFLIVMVVMASLFNYNEVINGPIILSKRSPAINLQFKINGSPVLREYGVGDTVRQNSVLGVIENGGSLEDIQFLKQHLNSIPVDILFEQEKDFPSNLSLGATVQPFLSKFYELYQEYFFIQRIKANDPEINLIENEIASINFEIQSQVKDLELARRNSNIQNTQKERRQHLYKKGIISKQELEEVEKSFIVDLREQQNSERQYLNLNQEKLRLNGLKEGKLEKLRKDENRIVNELLSSRQELLAAVIEWEEDYVLKSPVDGEISYVRNTIGREKVTPEDIIISIVPHGDHEIIGKAAFPSYNFSEVNPGQKALIKVDNYSYSKWGVLTAYVESIIALPVNNGKLNYEVIFRVESLRTTYNHNLILNRELSGEVEILLEEKSLLQRILGRIKV